LINNVDAFEVGFNANANRIPCATAPHGIIHSILHASFALVGERSAASLFANGFTG
jgi:hypothetical protein